MVSMAPNLKLRRRLRRLDEKGSPYLYIAPFFVIFGAFGAFPLAFTFYVSLHEWDLLGPHTWVGMDNYRELLGDTYFWNALRNTASIWVLTTVPQLAMALGLAHVLNTRLRARTLFRMGVLLPNVTSIAAVTIIFAQLFGRDFGLVNYVLGLVGVDPVGWQSERIPSHLAIAAIVNWRWTGYNALIYLAAMQAIPSVLYDAARLDGAGPWRQFTNVTIPMVRPTIIFTVIVSTIYNLQILVEPLLFNANPGTSCCPAGRSSAASWKAL
jgi:cellobiose transport system permease protein